MTYDSSFKLKAIEKAKELGSNHNAADFFGVTEKMIRDWRKKEGQLKTVKKTDKRLKGCGRSIRDRGSDDRIMQWLSDARDEGHPVTGVMLQLQCVIWPWWLEKLKKWHVLSTWRGTSIGQKMAKNAEEKVIEFHKILVDLFKRNQHEPRDV